MVPTNELLNVSSCVSLDSSRNSLGSVDAKPLTARFKNLKLVNRPFFF